MKRLTCLLCLLMSILAVAHNYPMIGMWLVECTRTDGSYIRVGGFLTEEDCKAGISAVVKREGGCNGHCVEFDPKTAKLHKRALTLTTQTSAEQSFAPTARETPPFAAAHS
jgi:hypothetical protein